MASAEEGGATTVPSPYGGEGGAGGKFRRKPFRKPATPYDRPAITLRGNGSSSSSSWLTKLVDPASRLLSYGARRFFDSVFRKRLPPPPPPQISDSNHVPSDGLPEAVPSEPEGDECSQQIINYGRNGISDLEQLLKQKKFTRSEVNYLTELLHSRGEVPLRDDGPSNEETVPNFGKHQQIESGLMKVNRTKGDEHHGFVSTHISNAKVLGNSTASPSDLAKAYMGSKPSKLSPSALSNYSQVTREDTNLLSNMRIASIPVSEPLTTKTVFSSGSPENGYIPKPSSLRRSAIYNMSRSPYLKRAGINHNVDAGLPMPSTSLSIERNSERYESKSLKRRSFVLDDQVGSVGPIRRIRQKSNLIAPGVPHSGRVERDSDAMLEPSKQKLPLIGDPRHIQRNELSTDISIPSSSYAIVPYESNNAEVVERRSRNLEKIALMDRSESKVLVAQQNSPFKLKSSMLRGQALKSLEDATYSELLMNVQDDHKFVSSAGLLDAHDFHPQEQGKVKENDPVETSVPSNVINNDSAVSFEASLGRDGTSDYVNNGLSQPQNKAAFRMSALEDYVDLDDDLPCNGLASRPFSEERGPLDAHLTDSKFSTPEERKVLESATLSELKSPSGRFSSKTNEVSSGVAGASSLGEGNNDINTPLAEEVTSALPTIPSPPTDAFDRHKEIKNPQTLFGFSSKVADKFPTSLPESSCRTPESSTSLLNVSAPSSSLLKVVEQEKSEHPKPLAAKDTSGKFDTVSITALNGPLVSGAPAVSFTATSNGNTDQISTASPAIFTPSVSVSDYIISGTSSISKATSSGSIFGATEAPKVSGEPATKFDASPDSSGKVTAVPTTIIPAEDLKYKASTDSSSGIPSSSSTKFVAFGAPSSGNMTSGLSSLSNIPSANNLQGSLFSSASKSFESVVGAVSQGTSAQSFPLASQPASNMNGGTSFVSSQSSSQVFSPIMSFGSSASSSGTGAVVSSGEPKSSLFGGDTSVSAGSAGGSSTFTTPSVFSFGFSSSSSSINATGSIGGATASGFSFGVGSSGPAPVTTSFFSGSSSTSAVGSAGGATASGFSLSSSGSTPVTTSLFSGSSSTSAVGSAGGATASGFSFGVSPSGSAPVTTSFFRGSTSTSAVGSAGGATASGFSFGVSSSGSAPVSTSLFSSSSSSTSAVGSTGGAAPVFSFGSSSPAPTTVSNAASSFSNGAPGLFKFGGSSLASSSAFNSNNAPSNAFGSSLQSPTSSIFGSSPATGFSFGASATSSAAINSAPVVFNSSTNPSSSSPFSFTSAPASVFSSPSPLSQPVFGNPAPGFTAPSPGNNFQMSAEDSMAEDPVHSTAPSIPVFGSPAASGFVFGSSVPSQPSPFQFGGQQTQGVAQNPSMFQPSSSVEFNAGGSFSLGSGGDKSGRKFVKANRNKNRKK